MDKGLIRDVVNSGLAYEQVNSEIVRFNLAIARNKLQKEWNKNPNGLTHLGKMSDALDFYLDEVNRNINKDFNIESTLNEGVREGKFIVGSEASIPRDSDFWGWTPSVPINAIGLAESEMANLIRGTTKQLKERILRTVQVGIASGASIGDIQDSILGTGLRGLKGKDGVWRTATSRGEMQARTITNDLINRGALITYNDVDNLCPELDLKKVWQTVSDKRTSDICANLNGQVRELKESFSANGWSGANPPAHPNCRSRVTVLSKKYRKEFDKRFSLNDGTKNPIRDEKLPKINPKTLSPRMATKAAINPEEVSFGDDLFYSKSYTKEQMIASFNELSKNDPEMRKRFIDLFAYSEKKKDTVIFGGPNLSDGDIENILKGLRAKYKGTPYEKSIGYFSTDKNNPLNLKIGRKTYSSYEWTDLAFRVQAGGHTSPSWPFLVVKDSPMLPDIRDTTKSLTLDHLNRNIKDVERFKRTGLKIDLPSHIGTGSFNPIKVSDEYQLLATQLHETGHRVHFDVMAKTGGFKKPPKSFTEDGNISLYGYYVPGKSSDHQAAETFAEAFTLYQLNPKELERLSPSLFRWADDAWKLVNI